MCKNCINSQFGFSSLNHIHFFPLTRLLICLILLLLSFRLFAQKKNYTTAKLENDAINIDGLLNEKAWDKVEWGGDFVQTQPYENRSPSQQTKFKIFYDDNNLYVAIKAFDTAPDSIVKRMSRRDGFDGDWVEINIDSYHDLRTAFSFTINAAGVKGDEAITDNGNNWDASWDPIWYVKTSFDSEGWNAEMKIPFTQLRFGKQDVYVWGMQFTRRLFRKEERSCWQFISPNAPGWVHLFGELYGIAGIKPRKQADITPYAVTSLDVYKKEKDNPFSKGVEPHISGGLDGKFGVTNDLTLDLTINPDFGQVEADPSVVNLSTFETYYDEKRPFFIEGRNIMDYNQVSGGPLWRDNLFYSRRIGRQPQLYPQTDSFVKLPGYTTIFGAGKLTGKTKNGWSVGALESVTKRELAEIDNNNTIRTEPVEPLTNYFLGRVQKDINEGNTRFGGMFAATNRQINDTILHSLHKEAYTGGFDFGHQWKNKTYYFNVKTIFSYIGGTKESILNTQTSGPRYFQRPDARHLKVDSARTSLTGTGGTVTFGKGGNSKWLYMIWVTWRSPMLELNDLGYLYQPDIIQEIIWIGYQNFEPKGIYRSYFINFDQWYGSTFGGERLYTGTDMSININFKNFWFLNLGGSFDTPSLSTSDLRGGPSIKNPATWYAYYNVSTNSKKKLIFSLGGNNTIGIHNAYSYININAGITWRISNALNLSLSPTINKNINNTAYTPNTDDIASDLNRYIRSKMNQTETMLTIRVNYNITPDFTIQYYGMPFISAAAFADFKYISDSKANKYKDRFINYSSNQIKKVNSGDDISYSVDENLDGAQDYSFDNPDFNVFQFRSNFVARWEYKPGSIIYLVWAFSQSDQKNTGVYSFFNDAGQMFKIYPYNTFLIKISYRLGK